VVLPEGHDADLFRASALKGWDISLGSGLGKLSGRVFRIGHLGDFNDLMLMGTLAGVELGLRSTDVPFKAAGLAAAIDVLSRPQSAAVAPRRAVSA
jgi:alanine-glyoxylate transaminase/serine-glyoxylate transaminase/serine-pyruvate transaminase